MTRDTGLNWSRRRDFWRLRRDGETVALVVPHGLRWQAIGFRDCQRAYVRTFDGQQQAMGAAEDWARRNAS